MMSRPFEDFQQWVAGLEKEDVPLVYGLATSWAGWIQANSDDFNAIADLGRVKAIISRVATSTRALSTAARTCTWGFSKSCCRRHWVAGRRSAVIISSGR